MVRITALIAAAFAALFTVPASAQSLAMVSLPVVYVQAPVVQQVHAGRPIAGVAASARPSRWQRPAPAAFAGARAPAYTPARSWDAPHTILTRPADYNRGLAQYGPFRVLDAARVALVGETDATTPGFFRAMLRDYPGLRQIDMVECPGTRDDRANMAVGRMIRAAGLATWVPPAGSVRSGAVELFLAGARRQIADGAEFAVHSWMDDYGREASDFALDAPENRQYLDYYREMGMTEHQARAFYAMTNSVPHREALWLEAREMRGWVAPTKQRTARRETRSAQRSTPRIVYAALSLS